MELQKRYLIDNDFQCGIRQIRFFSKMYQMIEDKPNDLLAFQKLYLENESYSLNENI